jgi:flagellar hook-length control protein FliK
MPKSAPATLDPILAPVPPQATPTTQETTTTQAVLAEDLSRSKGKGLTGDLQAAQKAQEATPPTADATADPVAVKTGLNLAATPAPQGAPAEAPAKASVQVPASGLNFEPSQVDPAATKALPFTHAMEAVPSEPAPAAASVPQHADSSAMSALSAQPRTSTLAASATPAAPLPNTPAQPSAQASPLVTQVAGGVRWMLQGGSQEAQLQLHPDSLGQVTIHLRVEGGEVHARLWVSEASSVQAVQEGRPHLEASLKEQGLQLGSFDLQQGQRPFQEAPATPAYPGRPVLDLVPAGQEAPVPPVASILNSRHVELYA